MVFHSFPQPERRDRVTHNLYSEHGLPTMKSVRENSENVGMTNDRTADLKQLDLSPKSLFRNILRVSDLSSIFYEESRRLCKLN